MKWPFAWRLLYALAFLSCVIQGQDICDTFVVDNSFIIDEETIGDVDALGASMQDLMDCLSDGGSITLDVRNYEPDQTLEIRRNVDIISNVQRGTTMTCNGAPLFDISGAEVQISNLRVRNCNLDSEDAPVVVRSQSTVTFTSVTFEDNVNRRGTAAITAGGASSVIIEDSSFFGNAGMSASAVRAGRNCNVRITGSDFEFQSGRNSTIVLRNARSLIVSDSLFRNNTARHQPGAAINIENSQIRTDVQFLQDTIFENNLARQAPGGAVSIHGDVSLTVEDARFTGNWAWMMGGAIFLMGTADVTIRDSFFIENAANFTGGGAIYAENGTSGEVNMVITNSLFSRNDALTYMGSGGAVRLNGRGLRCNVTDSVFALNTAELDGGGLFIANGARVRVESTTFVGNECFRGGGPAIFVVSIQQIGAEQMLTDINNSTFFFNRALGGVRGGGGVGATGFGLEINITNSWFSDNDGGQGSGGAIYIFNGPNLDLENNTFTSNRAVFGGALYGENDARFVILNCTFTENVADEGGAILTQGDVDTYLRFCRFMNNSALTEGGAFKVLNYKSGEGELARVDIAECTMIGNRAGSNLFEDALYGTQTGGGGLLVTGNGVDLTLMENLFEFNEAAEGGALNVKGVGDCQIGNGNMFLNNTANSGGAIFILVDERITPRRFNFYMVSNSEFESNMAADGGGIFVGANKVVIDGQSVNARRFLVRVEFSTFTNNCVLHGGGGLALFGSGVIVDQCSFARNHANAAEGYAITPAGGALRVSQGAGLEINASNFTSNEAVMGGAASITDASVKGQNLIFRRNAVRDNGIGGAVAIDLSPGKDIPVINAPATLRNIVFQCEFCSFIRNNGSLRGGALHLHDLNSAVGASFVPECSAEQVQEANFGNGGLTCTISYSEYLLRLQRRAVSFKDTQFRHNTAKVGGAIFTNHAALINVTADLAFNQQHLLDDNTTFTETDARVTFEGNSNFDEGFGEDTATTPVVAKLKDLSGKESSRQTNLTYDDFASGDRLRFHVTFLDEADQLVTVGMNVTATIVFCDDCSEGRELEISGQDTAVMNPSGEIDFTATRLRGRPNKAYLLRIDYSSSEELMTMPIESSFVHVMMRPCRIGESTNLDETADVIECVKCIPGTFTANPNVPQCFSCADVGHGRCSGDAIIPDEGYWHATSFSFNMRRCIGHASCTYEDREDTIADVAVQAHEQGVQIFYSNDSSQCTSGYTGPLCGSCANGYGREGQRCRKCSGPVARSILMILFIFWTFAFLSYFIRSVLQLAARIEFNRRFNTAPTDHQRRFIESIHAQPNVPNPNEAKRYPGGRAAGSEIGESSTSQQVLTEASPSNEQTGPSKKDLARVIANRINVDRLKALRPPSSVPEEKEKEIAAGSQRKGRLAEKLQALANVTGDGDEVEPLTLCNPVSEILKIALNFLQVTAVAASINVDWTDSVRRSLFAFGSIGAFSSGSGLLSLDCFMVDRDNPKSLRRMTIMILYPLMIFFVYIVFWVIYTYTKKRPISYFNQRVWLTYLAINYFVYIGMTKHLLRFFACADISDDLVEDVGTDRVWEEDSAVECYSRRHALTVGILVVPLLCAVTIGFPLGTFIILRNYKERLNEENIIATYGFLYRAYDQHYWEIVIMMRKALIATIAVFAYVLGENLQGLMCILVMVLALGLHLAYQPFTKEVPQLNVMETCSLCTTVFVFVVGLMMNDEQTGQSARVFLSLAAIIAMSMTFGMMLVGLVVASEEVLDMKLIEEEVMEITKILDTRLSKKLEALIMHYWKRGRKIVQRMFSHLEERFGNRARTRQAQGTLRRQTSAPGGV